jgi:hypothetical protein
MRELPAEERRELVDRLYDVAEAPDPAAVVDPYMPGGMGPVPYHGVVVAGRVVAVVSLYAAGGIRVISVRPHT